LESKSQSLQLTVDRLSLALTKSEELESASKDKMQQMSLSLSDHNQTIQDLQQRLSHLQKALTTSEQDRRIAQERLDNTRVMLQEHKLQNQQMSERLQNLQNELTDLDIRRGELESQNRQINNTLTRRQETEHDLNKQLQAVNQPIIKVFNLIRSKQMQALRERQELQERVASLQRTLCETEAARDQLLQASTNLEKDRHCLRRHLEKVEKEKIQHEEILSKGNLDRTELELTLRRLEEENADQKRQVHYLQTRLNELEQMHAQRLAEVASKQRAETEMEMERLRHNQIQAERALEARERAHRQRVKVLEDQMGAIREQLATETRKRQQLLSGKSGAVSGLPTKLSEKPFSGNSREVRRHLESADIPVKAYLSTGDLRRGTCCSGTEKKTSLDRTRASGRGLHLSRK
uniref:Cilia- and flagella-associated protein 157 n=1 Tax=Echinostoma caproni TaxID=27848 RepID=A0A183ACT8_9TREM